MSACCVQVILFDQLGRLNIKGLESQDDIILSHQGHTHPDGCFLCVLANPFAYVAHFVFLRAVWVRTQIAAVAKQARYQLSNPSPCQYCFVLCFPSAKAIFTA